MSDFEKMEWFVWRPHALTHNEPAGFENCMLTFLINIHQSLRTGGSGLWYAIFWEFSFFFFSHSVWKHRKYTLDLRISNCREIRKPFSNLIKSMWANVSSSQFPFKLWNLWISFWEDRHRVFGISPLCVFIFWNLYVISEWSGRNDCQRPKQAAALRKNDMLSRAKPGCHLPPILSTHLYRYTIIHEKKKEKQTGRQRCKSTVLLFFGN